MIAGIYKSGLRRLILSFSSCVHFFGLAVNWLKVSVGLRACRNCDRQQWRPLTTARFAG